jgi:hypothetical protein
MARGCISLHKVWQGAAGVGEYILPAHFLTQSRSARTPDEIATLARGAGLDVVQNTIDRRLLVNRARRVTMQRCDALKHGGRKSTARAHHLLWAFVIHPFSSLLHLTPRRVWLQAKLRKAASD